jgi:hypothetical protein
MSSGAARVLAQAGLRSGGKIANSSLPLPLKRSKFEGGEGGQRT